VSSAGSWIEIHLDVGEWYCIVKYLFYLSIMLDALYFCISSAMSPNKHHIYSMHTGSSLPWKFTTNFTSVS
jgi:hypothetical protein